jgi:hypothetical protein
VHSRSVELDSASRELRVQDEVITSRRHRCRLTYHLGPRIAVDLDGRGAQLRWAHRGRNRTAVLKLPGDLTWTAHRGETDPPLGWYSAGFGRREPAVSLVGRGFVEPGAAELGTLLRFDS